MALSAAGKTSICRRRKMPCVAKNGLDGERKIGAERRRSLKILHVGLQESTSAKPKAPHV